MMPQSITYVSLPIFAARQYPHVDFYDAAYFSQLRTPHRPRRDASF